MKKLILSAAFATLVASPVLAQSYTPDYGTGNVSAPALSQRYDTEATGSLAYAPRHAERFHREALPTRGQYQDPNITLQQRRDDLEY